MCIFPLIGMTGWLAISIYSVTNLLVIYFELKKIYELRAEYIQVYGVKYFVYLFIMMGVNIIRDFDLLFDTKFLKVIDKSDQHRGLFTGSLVIFAVTLIPRIIAAGFLTKSVYQYYYKEF